MSSSRAQKMPSPATPSSANLDDLPYHSPFSSATNPLSPLPSKSSHRPNASTPPNNHKPLIARILRTHEQPECLPPPKPKHTTPPLYHPCPPSSNTLSSLYLHTSFPLCCLNSHFLLKL